MQRNDATGGRLEVVLCVREAGHTYSRGRKKKGKKPSTAAKTAAEGEAALVCLPKGFMKEGEGFSAAAQREVLTSSTGSCCDSLQ